MPPKIVQFLEAFDPYGGVLYKYVDGEAQKVGLKLVMTLDTPFRSYAFTPRSEVEKFGQCAPASRFA